jgi:hypothetical protein
MWQINGTRLAFYLIMLLAAALIGYAASASSG